MRDSYRGISLLSIPGKVYVLVILAKISSHIDAQLLDNQSAFRKGRGLTDALFTIRQVISKSVAFDQPLFMAFVDLRKAYDYDYDYIMAPQRGRPYGANLGSMGRNTGTWSIRSECLSNITSWSRRKGIENTTLPFIPE